MDYATGTLGVGGDLLRAVELRFSGQLGPDFVEFTKVRGRRLGLRGQITGRSEDVLVLVEGPEALIDALEITCSLGPYDSKVETWSRRDLDCGVSLSEEW